MQHNNTACPESKLWWQPEYEFFGEFYLEGDDSTEGYLQHKKQTLEQRTATEVAGVINLLNISSGESILDLPCGYGRHSIGLAQKGFNVFGCDINPTHLHVAHKNSQKSNSHVTWLLGNMLDFKNPVLCDAVINMFYSFGFFDSDEENKKVLSNIYANLKEGGKFLFHTDVNIPRILSGQYKEYEERPLSSGRMLIIRDDYDAITKRINGYWLIKDGEQELNKRFYSVRVYTDEEFTALCHSVGFKTVQIYGDWDKTPYTNTSEDMIIIAQK